MEKLLTMKNLAGLDGSTQWLNVVYQANWSTADTHHSTVSVLTAGTCWAGPSRATQIIAHNLIIHELMKLTIITISSISEPSQQSHPYFCSMFY
jgi:hypothetical protein